MTMLQQEHRESQLIKLFPQPLKLTRLPLLLLRTTTTTDYNYVLLPLLLLLLLLRQLILSSFGSRYRARRSKPRATSACGVNSLPT